MLLRKSVTNLDALEGIEVGLQLLIVKFPLAGLLLCGNTIRVSEDSRVPTLATDGINIFYNPRYTHAVRGTEGTAGVVFRLAHEYLHIYLGHATRRRDRDPTIWNLVADLIVNNILCKVLNMGIPPEGISSIPGVTADNVEEAYAQYMALTHPAPQYQPGTPDAGKDPGDSDGEDAGTTSCMPRPGERDLLDPVADASETLKDLAEEIYVVSEVLREYNMQAISSLPGALQARLAELAASKTIPWERLLVGDILQSIPGDHVDWLSPKRSTYPKLYLPRMRSTETSLLVLAIDASASVQVEDHQQFQMSVRPAIQRAHSTHLLSFDERVTETLVIRHPGQLRDFKYAQGNHGYTSTLGVFAYCEALRTKPNVLVIETDGSVQIPETPPSYKVIWVLTSMGQELPWGMNYRMRTPWK